MFRVGKVPGSFLGKKHNPGKGSEVLELACTGSERRSAQLRSDPPPVTPRWELETGNAGSIYAMGVDKLQNRLKKKPQKSELIVKHLSAQHNTTQHWAMVL